LGGQPVAAGIKVGTAGTEVLGAAQPLAAPEPFAVRRPRPGADLDDWADTAFPPQPEVTGAVHDERRVDTVDHRVIPVARRIMEKGAEVRGADAAIGEAVLIDLNI